MTSSAIALVLHRPVNGIDILSWSRRVRVRPHWGVTISDASIVKDEHRVLRLSSEVVDLGEPRERRAIETATAYIISTVQRKKMLRTP